MTIFDLPTPALLVDAVRLERNLQTMQERALRAGVRLRPHAKTHKCAEIARRQLALGASGLTTAKVSEAEAFVENGFSDITIAFPVVGDAAHERLARLMERARVRVLVESPEGAQLLSDFFRARGRRVPVLLEVDVGYGRTGVRWDAPEAVSLYERLHALAGLEPEGVLTHAGHSYQGAQDPLSSRAWAQRISDEERDRIEALARALQVRGLPVQEVSVGSTPTAVHFRPSGRPLVTEMRPGNYVFFDAMQVALGSCALDEVALSVLATVVARHEEGQETRLYVDAGKKALTTDTHRLVEGYGIVADPETRSPYPGVRLEALSEEHGWIRAPRHLKLGVGSRVRIFPVHACVVANLFDQYVVEEELRVCDRWPIIARGRSQ
ncbi:MAG: alanine racemase [Bacteroidetes bacterium]|nr:alanine racemase [Rhodothermia bacterium]MCS7156015.1 alanine racemase [Bacteroidota bacterium]MCX7907703.1 alanine racemase [Bacteroidota bacterium]MDW8137832.1 alanine racemase [Bacteroidota bacterium]MDW8286317.1 alanine racemase [Bacteroidota bacterium]